jgi:capsular polysaccharide transport system permease protein
MLALVFSLLLRAPPLGTNFLLFYATGLLPFQAFIMISTKLAGSLTYSRQLLVYPRVTFVDALLARFLLNTLTTLLTSALVLTGILAIYTTQAAVDLPAILLSFSMSAALGAGLGTLNCFLGTRFTIWNSIWGVMMRPMVLISGVMFTFDSIPQPFRDWLWYNPLMHVTGEMRAGFYFNYAANYVSPAYVFGIALATGLVGMLFLRRYHRDILEL